MKIDERALLQERVRTLVLRHALQAVLERLAVATRNAGEDAETELLNLEQSLELARLLRVGGFAKPVVFVSSNTRDFADPTSFAKPHPDLVTELAAAGLEYASSLQVAIGKHAP